MYICMYTYVNVYTHAVQLNPSSIFHNSHLKYSARERMFNGLVFGT